MSFQQIFLENLVKKDMYVNEHETILHYT